MGRRRKPIKNYEQNKPYFLIFSMIPYSDIHIDFIDFSRNPVLHVAKKF